jgi:hypothetical protein
MEVCPGGERLRAALLRCLAAVGEGRRPYREAEPALRAAIGEIDSEVWRRGHGGAETALGKACGILAELTPEGSAKRAADEAKRVRLTQRKPVAVAVEQRPEPVRSEPEAAPVVAAAEEAGPADDREQAAREVRRAARREPPGLWRPLRSIQELEEWVSY